MRVFSLSILICLLIGLLGAGQTAGSGLAPRGAADLAPADSFDLSGPAGSVLFGASVYALPNGNIVITDPSYGSGGLKNLGAVYLYNGHTHTQISMLTGSQAGDQVGDGVVVALSGGDYVVASPDWRSGGVFGVGLGAVTLCSATTGCSGAVSTSNSLVGGYAGVAGIHAGDQVGYGFGGVTALSGGGYVVDSYNWNHGADFQVGAVTLCSSGAGGGNGSCTGQVVTTTNSLVGSHVRDQVGNGLVTALGGGGYVVQSPSWTKGAVNYVGAVTQCSGALSGPGSCNGQAVSSANSLTGGQVNDDVGGGVTTLSGGAYVVDSYGWNKGALSQVGAVTLCSAAGGCMGQVVTTTNSLVGSQQDDNVGIGGVTALSGGGYVVQSFRWAKGAMSQVGAVTLCSAAGSCTGQAVTTNNSLTGSQAGDKVGPGVTALSGGGYVVESYNWANGGVSNAGEVTLCSAAGSCTGQAVSTANSLVGSQANDYVGEDGVTALSGGGYVVASHDWQKGAASQVGAVTLCSAAGSCTGQAVSAANSLTGSQANDQVGFSGVTALTGGGYVVASPFWNNGTVKSAGAVTLCSAAGGCSGKVISTANSLTGSQDLDQAGFQAATALSSGGYVVDSSEWNNSAVTMAGAVTVCPAAGCSGTISSANSVLGAAANHGNSLSYTYDNFNSQLVVGRPYENLVTFFSLPQQLSTTIFLPQVQRN